MTRMWSRPQGQGQGHNPQGHNPQGQGQSRHFVASGQGQGLTSLAMPPGSGIAANAFLAYLEPWIEGV